MTRITRTGCGLKMLACCAGLLIACSNDDSPAQGTAEPGAVQGEAGASATGHGSAGAAGNAASSGSAGTAGSAVTGQTGGEPGAAGSNGSAGEHDPSGSDVGTGEPEQPANDACTQAQLDAACAGIACGLASTCDRFCGSCPSDQQCSAGQCKPRECGQLDLSIETYGSCALDIGDGVELDGEGFITADGRQQRVFALDRWGTGHFIAWCDASTLADVVEAVHARRYLGRSESARVASFGDDFMCNPAGPSAYPLPPYVTYLGLGLPAAYRTDAAALAEDWDAVLYCGYRAEWDDAWVPTLQSYVSEHGKGLLTALDYAGVDATPPDFAHTNAIIAPTGVTFLEVLNYQSTATVSVAGACVPDLIPTVE